MSQKYRVAFLLEGGTELRHKMFVRSGGVIWYAKSAPTEAKRVRIEKLDTQEFREFSVDSHDENAKYIQEIEKFLGAKND